MNPQNAVIRLHKIGPGRVNELRIINRWNTVSGGATDKNTVPVDERITQVEAIMGSSKAARHGEIQPHIKQQSNCPVKGNKHKKAPDPVTKLESGAPVWFRFCQLEPEQRFIRYFCAGDRVWHDQPS